MATPENKPPNYLSLLESGQYSDFIIECGGFEFKVHRSIVCPQSTFLQKAASGPFKEAGEQRCKLTEEDPKIMVHVLFFLYANDYDAGTLPKFCPEVAMSACEISDECNHGSVGAPGDKPDDESVVGDQGEADSGKEMVRLLGIHVQIFKYADSKYLSNLIFASWTSSSYAAGFQAGVLSDTSIVLGIQALKVIAAARFLEFIPIHEGYKTFDTVLDMMYRSTRSNDHLLRLPTTKICVQAFMEGKLCADLASVVKKITSGMHGTPQSRCWSIVQHSTKLD